MFAPGSTFLCCSISLHLKRSMGDFCIDSNCTGISITVTESIALQRITEGLLFDTEVVAGPDICNNFRHAISATVGKVT